MALFATDLQYYRCAGFFSTILQYCKLANTEYLLMNKEHLYSSGERALANNSAIRPSVYCKEMATMSARDSHLPKGALSRIPKRD